MPKPHTTRRLHSRLPTRWGRCLSHLFITSLAIIVGYALAGGANPSPSRLDRLAYAMPLEEDVLSNRSVAPRQAPSGVWLHPEPTLSRDDTGEPDDAGVEGGQEGDGGPEEAPRSGVSSRGGMRLEAPSEEAPAAHAGSNQRIADTAMEHLGAPYAWSGNSPRGFDCSGFVQYIYGKNGVSLPRDIPSMINQGERVQRDSLEPGDIVIFANTFERGLSHVGIYLGEGRFIHSISERRGVGIDTMYGGFWGAHYYSAIRF